MGFKGMDKDTALERVQKLTKAVRNGTFKDETFHLLEIQLRQLEQFIHDTLDQKAEPVSTSPQAEPDDVYEALDNFTTSLKLSNWRP